MYASSPLGPRLGRGAVVVMTLTLIGLGALGATRPRDRPTDGALAAPALPPIAKCRERARPDVAVLLVQLRSPGFDLAGFIDADRPGGFAVEIAPLTYRPRGITGDLATWRRLTVAMDHPAARALASRLSQLPPIADVRIRTRP